MNTVFFNKTDSYNYLQLRKTIGDLLDKLDIRDVSGCKVLIKPDFLYVGNPAQAVTTHPAVVRAVCTYFLDHRARVSLRGYHVGGKFNKYLKSEGYNEALADLPIKTGIFKEAVPVEFGKPFGQLKLPKELIEAEMFVNVPKLKTHSHLAFNGCISNVFDCISLAEKRRCQLATGGDIEVLAEVMAKVGHTLKPEVNLVDGVTGLQGLGPGPRGKAVNYGVIVAGDDSFYVDAALGRFLGLGNLSSPVLMQAAKLGLFDPNILEIAGEFFSVRDLKQAPSRDFFPVPQEKEAKARRSFYQRVVVKRKCNLCGACYRVCPLQGIKPDPKGKKVIIPHEKCIRCYSCVAVCPRGVLVLKNPFWGKFARKLYNKGELIEPFKPKQEEAVEASE